MSSIPTGSVEPRKVEQILAQLDQLPPLAPVATRILTLTEDSAANARDIVRLIESDPALTARVLSLLSRADRGVGREMVTVENAVRLLGFDAIRQITLAVKVMEVFGAGRRGADEGFDRQEFWKHCLGVACAARRIAEVLPGSVRPEEAFVLGLLHDIGKAAVQVTMPKSFARIQQRSAETRTDLTEVERSVLGVDHTMVGHRLAERWGLPRRLVDCLWLHHHAPEMLPASVATGRHVQMVQLADTLVREHRIGYSGNYFLQSSSSGLARALGVTDENRRAIVESLGAEIEARAAWIGVEDITDGEVYLKALLRTTEELTTANGVLSEQIARLERRAQYFTALAQLNQRTSPTASVRDVCAAGAEVLRRALPVSCVLVFVTSEDGRWVEVGWSDGQRYAEIFEQGTAVAYEADIAVAVQSVSVGTLLTVPGNSFSGLIARYRSVLGTLPLWLLPLVRQQRWIGGALLAAEAVSLAPLRGEQEPLEALTGAIALALAQAQAQASAISLNDELADANRRWAAMQPELLRAKTLETIVAMAAGAAHELNNPLAVISGRAQMLQRRVTDDDSRRDLALVVEQAHACSGIVTELMDFAQPPAARPEQVRLPEILDEIKAELVAAGLWESAVWGVEIASDTPAVYFDRAQIIRMFRELLNNAFEATNPTNRQLSIKARPDLTEEYVVMEVADNGRGMTTEVRGHATAPFFSQRPAGRGRGLGLARVQRWLQQNGGRMTIDSDPGAGTRVILRLPTAARKSE